jgi:hypothetical protein
MIEGPVVPRMILCPKNPRPRIHSKEYIKN